jgi:hypothetical protein
MFPPISIFTDRLSLKILFSYRFEIKGLKGEALKPVLTITLPHHKQPVDSE